MLDEQSDAIFANTRTIGRERVRMLWRAPRWRSEIGNLEIAGPSMTNNES